MALTLAEAAKLSNDVLLTGVVETIIKDSPVLQRLPFVEIVGNGLTYNREDAAPFADFFDVGDTWTESTPTFTQQTVTLKIMGGDADIDNFLIATRSNIQDVETAVVQLKAKAVQQLFEQTFVTGDEGVDPKEFDGLDQLCDPSQTISMGVNGGSLTLDKLDELIDANLTTAGEAANRAETVLRDAALEAFDGRITVTPNCAQELYDVIEVTDAVAGLAAAKRRVLGLRLRYSAEKGEYTQELELGGV